MHIDFKQKFQRIKQKIKYKFKRNYRKVDFIIIGTQKSGTTALDTYFRYQHPKICMADHKELHYFDSDSFFLNNQPDYHFYHSLFSPKKSHQLIGEITPIYLYWHQALARIYAYNPNCKLIVILRNPVDRAYSHWNMNYDRGKENLNFLAALKAEPIRAKKQAPEQLRAQSYIDRGFYTKQLQTLWQYFPKHQTLILKSNYLKKDPQQVLDEICHFLAVETIKNVRPMSSNTRSYQKPMSKTEKQYLHYVFTSEIQKLEKMLGWDCSDWLG